jgi:hypothetical protein
MPSVPQSPFYMGNCDILRGFAIHAPASPECTPGDSHSSDCFQVPRHPLQSLAGSDFPHADAL